MDEWLKRGIDLAWYVLLAWWLWSARGNKERARGEPWPTRVLLYWLPLVLAFVRGAEHVYRSGCAQG